MSDIELVVKIPDVIYEGVKMDRVLDTSIVFVLDAIKNGTPLPKGHGRLGDLDEIKKEMQNYYDDCAKTSVYTRLGFETAIAVVEDAPTIIAADKAESEE